MSKLNWTKWHHRETKEPLAHIRVDHFLSREEIAEILCASAEYETGTRLSTDAIMHCIRGYLKAATAMEPIEFWSDGSYTDEEADARVKWAQEQVSKL
jgi:hypothetical protein